MGWHAHHCISGTGHLYQGRFKSFPIEEDEHLLAVLRYVERNPLRADLCEAAGPIIAVGRGAAEFDLAAGNLSRSGCRQRLTHSGFSNLVVVAGRVDL